MADEARMRAIFAQLRSILQQFEPYLTVKVNTDDNYYLMAADSPRWKAEVMFGAVQIKKGYVSYYLMPVYMYPDLLETISPKLRRRMQGKSCFNFKSQESDLWRDLTELTARSFERFRVENIP